MARVLDGDPLDEQPGAGGEDHEIVGAHRRCGAAIDGPRSRDGNITGRTGCRDQRVVIVRVLQDSIGGQLEIHVAAERDRVGNKCSGRDLYCATTICTTVSDEGIDGRCIDGRGIGRGCHDSPVDGSIWHCDVVRVTSDGREVGRHGNHIHDPLDRSDDVPQGVGISIGQSRRTKF